MNTENINDYKHQKYKLTASREGSNCPRTAGKGLSRTQEQRASPQPLLLRAIKPHAPTPIHGCAGPLPKQKGFFPKRPNQGFLFPFLLRRGHKIIPSPLVRQQQASFTSTSNKKIKTRP